jgi:hypothetical protein
MYTMFYDVLQPKFEDRVKLIYTDTGSMVLSFDSPDLNAELLPLQDHFDNSKLPTNHPLYSHGQK